MAKKLVKQKASFYTALAWKDLLSHMMGTYLVVNFEEIEPKDNKSSGNNKWQNNQQQQKPAVSYDDEGDKLPF